MSGAERERNHDLYRQNESYQAGVQALQQKDISKAIQYFEACHVSSSQNTLCLWELGWAYKANFQIKKNIEVWEELAAIDHYFFWLEKGPDKCQADIETTDIGERKVSLYRELKKSKKLYIDSQKNRIDVPLMSFQQQRDGVSIETHRIVWEDNAIVFIDGEEENILVKNCTEGPVFKGIKCIQKDTSKPADCHEYPSSFDCELIHMLAKNRKPTEVYPHFKKVLSKFVNHCECPDYNCVIDALFYAPFER